MSNQIDFTDIEYLNHGNPRQRLAFKQLNESGIFTHLAEFTPLLAGTIPIEIDIETSDLDIICYAGNEAHFIETVSNHFRLHPAYSLRKTKTTKGDSAIVVNFRLENFEVEIFAQNTPVKEQYAYRHMLIEQIILAEKGEVFRQQIIKLKQNGIKTEPAFASLLGLEGDAYDAFLNLEDNIRKPLL